MAATFEIEEEGNEQGIDDEESAHALEDFINYVIVSQYRCFIFGGRMLMIHKYPDRNAFCRQKKTAIDALISCDKLVDMLFFSKYRSKGYGISNALF